jgi:nitrogen fixation protein FixH
MRLFRLISEYRWPIYIAGHLSMSVVACGVLVWVATRPDAPRPIPRYYQTAQAWDADTAVTESSQRLGWQVRFDLPRDVPHYRGMPRPVDVTVLDTVGAPVADLTGQLSAIRPADSRLREEGTLVALPQRAGCYRTLLRLDAPGVWELRIDAVQHGMRFVHRARLHVPDGDGPDAEVSSR